MPFDLAFWVETGISSSVLVLLLLLIAGVRQFTRSLGNIPALFKQFLDGMLWEDAEIVAEDGTKAIQRRPNSQVVAAIQALVPVIAPVLLAEGSKWAKENIKFKMPEGMMGGSEGGSPLAGIIGQFLPKKYQGIAGLIGPFLGRMLPGLGGGAPGAPGGSTGPVAKVR